MLWVDVNSDFLVNSGLEWDSLLSVKGGLSYIINDVWQVYVNVGQFFYFNDVWGVVISVDLVILELVMLVDLLVCGVGSEVGIWVVKYCYYNVFFVVWQLCNDFELVFVGDVGNIEVSWVLKWWGVEFFGYYWFNSNLIVDVEFVWM